MNAAMTIAIARLGRSRGGDHRTCRERNAQCGLPEKCDHDGSSFPRLFSQQVTDGFLLQRLRRRKPDVDLLGVGARVPEQARVHEMIVHHDVGRRETVQAANRDEPRIARAGANQIDDALGRKNLVGSGL